MSSSRTTQALQNTLAAYPQLQLALLFGSMAAGSARDDSDVDVAVQAAHPLTSQLRLQLVVDLALAMDRAVDLVDLRVAGGPLLLSSPSGFAALLASAISLYVTTR